ncbi:GMC oxidoreductase [Crucibulum laeve]|uniref:pyranose dehydrogenase (acceptor) n=1 Tax=Crucibulum laeve TaxID=68775 RepID=A0A5C3LRC3_9AGAR|nr:GMC oxidoreductase [Crucibulum laeve]
MFQFFRSSSSKRRRCRRCLRSTTMGGKHSKVIQSDPSLFATANDQGDRTSKWKSYDYVIVGGGAAGCVLASRLSEDANNTVLLIEAGKSNEKEFLSKIPFAFSKMLRTAVDWDFLTTPQAKSNQREIYFPRGKILGGSSSINALIHMHCSPEDFDGWARNGAEGWSYIDLHPYLLKSEKYLPSPEYPGINLADHGRKGPWKVTHLDSAPINQVLLDTCEQLGIKNTRDLNTPHGPLGASTFAATVDEKGQRSSAATAYLTPEVLARPNLTIAVNCRVAKIMFEKSSGSSRPRAIGVEISSSPSAPLFKVRANKEVLLASGAIGTPHLLLLSGVGPATELREKGVEVVKDLPAVGKNLSDHISCGGVIFRAKSGSGYTFDYLNSPLSSATAMVKWLFNGKGPLGTLAAPGAAFVRSNDSTLPFTSLASANVVPVDRSAGPKSPDIEIIWFPAIVLDFGFKKPPAGLQGLTISGVAIRPESTGQVLLNSKSIWDKPIIDANYFDSENDLNVVVRAVRLILRMARAKPLASVLELHPEANKNPIFWPGSADPDEVTDEQLKEWIRENSSPAWHPTSSARMGLSESSSVVDLNLRVHGIDGLRVIDASAFPTIVSGHPCAPVIALAEKASDLIQAA